MVHITHFVVGCATVAGTEEGSEHAVGGCGSHRLVIFHVAKFGTAIELTDATVAYYGGNVACDGLDGIDTSTIETLNVSTIDKPVDIAFDFLHARSRHLAEAATVDIALGVLLV